MVREARFAWDDRRSLPSEIAGELSRRDWDCDDPGMDEDLPVRRRKRRTRTQYPAQNTPDANDQSGAG